MVEVEESEPTQEKVEVTQVIEEKPLDKPTEVLAPLGWPPTNIEDDASMQSFLMLILISMLLLRILAWLYGVMSCIWTCVWYCSH